MSCVMCTTTALWANRRTFRCTAPFVQLPFWFLERRPTMALVVRTPLDVERLAAAVRREVSAVNRSIPVFGVQTMETTVAQSTEQSRLSVMLLALFGALALVLVTLGIYGVLSFLVGRRTREIGIRLALGATRADVTRLIVGYGMGLAAIGTAIGLAASWGITQSMRTLLSDLVAARSGYLRVDRGRRRGGRADCELCSGAARDAR